MIFLVTSVDANDGKSTISKRMANDKVLSGDKVLLIDLDIRESDRIGQGNGIVEYMNSNVSINDCIIKEDNYLVFLPCLKKRKDFDAVFKADIFEEFLKSSEFDTIIIDTPPFGFIGDAKYLIPYCNEIILVNHRNQQYIRLMNRLSEFNKPITIVDNFY